MTDEERQKLCTKLRDGSYLTWDDKCAVADEIERLVKEFAKAKHHDMRDWYDALDRGRKDPIR